MLGIESDAAAHQTQSASAPAEDAANEVGPDGFPDAGEACPLSLVQGLVPEAGAHVGISEEIEIIDLWQFAVQAGGVLGRSLLGQDGDSGPASEAKGLFPELARVVETGHAALPNEAEGGKTHRAAYQKD